MKPDFPSSPLDGLRVLDFTVMLAGPFTTMMLADYGADVIKIEQPRSGDPARAGGPFVPEDVDRSAGGFFLSINRNKRGITLDLKTPRAREIVAELVRVSDAVVENFRPGVMERLGMDYAALHAINPRIVYTSISGFGQTGPYRDRPSFDVVAQAMGGPMSITGPRGGHPYKFGPGIGDIWPAAVAAFSTMVALHHAERTGEGQHVDCAMYDSMIYLMERALMMYSLAGIVSEPEGNSHPLYAPYDCFATRDGKFVVIAAHWDNHWRNLCKAMEREDLTKDPRFRGVALRADNYAHLRPILDDWCRSRDRDCLVALLLTHGVPAGPVHSVEDIFACPQVRERQMLETVRHPLGKYFYIVGIPAKLSSTPGAVRRAAPGLGEHNREVYGSLLGYQATEIEEMYRKNVI